MSRPERTNHPRRPWGLFLTVLLASMIGFIFGGFVTDQPNALATPGLDPDRFGIYSPIEREPGGSYSQTMETELPAASPGSLLSVHNTNGRIVVGSWDKSSIWIQAKKQVKFRSGWFGFLGFGSGKVSTSEAKKGLDRVEVTIDRTSESLVVKTVLPNLFDGMSSWIDYEILVPIHGNVEVHTTNGGVEIREIEGEVKAHSTNGRIELDEIRGPATVFTSNGRFVGNRIVGPLKATSTNGRIEVKSVDSVSELKSSNGSIEVELTGPPIDGEAVTCESSNGRVHLRLPDGSSFHVDLKSGNGSINSQFPLNQDAVDDRHRVKGTIGDGGGMIHIRTRNGSIHLDSYSPGGVF